MKYNALAPVLVMLLTAPAQAMAQTATDSVTNQSFVHEVPDPGGYNELFQAARALAQSGKHEDAIRSYSELLERSPGNVDVLLARGRVYAWMGRWREAENDLRAAVAASPDYADAWSALGDMYLWSDRAPRAIEAYGRWIQLRPDEAAPRVARGRALRATGDYTGARADFEAAAARGAEADQIASHLQSLVPRVQNPEATIPEGYYWSAGLSAKSTTFNRGRDGWDDYSVWVRRHFDGGSLAVEFLDARRFGLDDQAWALDAYVDLWNRAYANLRYQHGPRGELFPDRAWRVEVFQGIGRGWELSASYDRLGFDPTAIGMYGLGVGKYTGNLYLLARTLSVSGAGSSNLSHRGLVRYYYPGDGDNYVEVSAGSGRSSDELARTLGANDTDRRSSVGVAFVRYWNPRWGFKIGADYADAEQGYAERGISGTLYWRW